MEKDIYDFTNEPPKKEDKYLFLAGVCIFLGLLFTALLFINQPTNSSQSNGVSQNLKDYFTVNGTIGDFISGTVGTLFSLAGFFLIYLSFKSQQEALLDQRNAFEKERLESRFFELLKLHKENVSEMEYNDPVDEKKKYTGRRVFKYINDQIETCFSEIKPFFDDATIDVIFTEDYIESKKNILIYRPNIDITNWAHCNIAYTIVFFGLSNADFNTLSNRLSKTYQYAFYLPILNYLHLKPNLKSNKRRHWDLVSKQSLQQVINNIRDIGSKRDFSISEFEKDTIVGSMKVLMSKKYFKYYGGHQYKLGHYYRHLYQMVTYIDEQNLTYYEKYEYVKILRAQLSNYEQVVFFFNTLSFMGEPWELANYDAQDLNLHLVTKYNLIKNIPELYQFREVLVKDYYPNVAFEFEDEPMGRKKLIENYV